MTTIYHKNRSEVDSLHIGAYTPFDVTEYDKNQPQLNKSEEYWPIIRPIICQIANPMMFHVAFLICVYSFVCQLHQSIDNQDHDMPSAEDVECILFVSRTDQMIDNSLFAGLIQYPKSILNNRACRPEHHHSDYYPGALICRPNIHGFDLKMSCRELTT